MSTHTSLASRGGPAVHASKTPARPIAAHQDGRPASHRLESLLLRIGLAFVFAYATWSMLLEPSHFTRYLPAFVPEAWATGVCLPVFSVFEGVLAACFLAGRRLFVASVLSALTLAGIIAFNMDSFEVLFRNVAIACAALALAVHAREADGRNRAGRPATA